MGGSVGGGDEGGAAVVVSATVTVVGGPGGRGCVTREVEVGAAAFGVVVVVVITPVATSPTVQENMSIIEPASTAKAIATALRHPSAFVG